MEKMKSIDIKGKAYVPVNERIKHFRTSDEYKGYSLTSEFIKLEIEQVIIKAIITNSEGRIVATGFAEEIISADYKNVNSTSMIENCETSAWGRALGCLGIGIDASIASAEEVNTAIHKQEVIRTRTQSNTVPQPTIDNPNDPRPPLGHKWTDNEGLVWIVRERKADGARFWAAMDKSNRTQHIGTLEDALNGEG